MAKILVVDDEADILEVTVFRLEKAGYEVSTAEDGGKVLKEVKEKRPDLVLLDLRLPVIDGYEVCRRIKADEDIKNIPVILFTASAYDDMPEKAKALHAADYITKPFDYKELLGKIEKQIGR